MNETGGPRTPASVPPRTGTHDATPGSIQVRGARVHNLKDVDVAVPLRQLVAIAGVSGSGKSSLAFGVLYAEGSRRYVEALSTYTRRRMAHAPRAHVDSVRHVPAALALRQRPGVSGVRSTLGTSTELLNVLRLMFSRLASHLCPNEHRVAPTIDVAADRELVCPECGAAFRAPGAEALAFNSGGACRVCAGTGTVREIDEAALVPDVTRSIAEGAVLPWSMFGLTVMPQVAAELGVRLDVPYRDLTSGEREIVMHGPEEKRHISVRSKNGKLFEMDFTYRNARRAVQEALDGATTERGLARVNRFITPQVCPTCLGTRLSERARAPRIAGINLAQATEQTLDEIVAWAPGVVGGLPGEMQPMARDLVGKLLEMAARLVELGLGYLTLDRASLTLSTGERQRVQLARTVRNQTTGVLYVLDEPSIGLHPSNVDGLLSVIGDLLADGNSVVLVDHDVQALQEADWIIEMGPGSGREGGTVITEGTVETVAAHPDSLIGGFLAGRAPVVVRHQTPAERTFDRGRLLLETRPLHTVHALAVELPRGRLTAVTGASGSGKTTFVLDSLVPAVLAHAAGAAPPEHVVAVQGDVVAKVHLVDATPIGINVRSTVATYSGVMDDLRRAYAAAPEAVTAGHDAAAFSYNTGSLRCPRCEGTGQIALDVQFLPDVDIPCPDCEGSRYAREAYRIRRPSPSLPDGAGIAVPTLLALTVREAIEHVGDLRRVHSKLEVLAELGLGYLTLGQETPALSGGEAQRLKLATELHRRQNDALFVLDEPSVGLHPLDVRTLLDVLQRLLDRGATVVVIEHDLDMIANADYVIDMGPGGGAAGGRVVATGTPGQICGKSGNLTAVYLARHLKRGQH